MKQVAFEPDKYYHLFNRGNNKENIFKDDENYFYFLSLVKKHLLPTCEIFAYCLLPNHFHFLLRIKSSSELPPDFQSGKKKIWQPFSNLFNAYSKAINKRYNRTGSLFQEHLHRIHIETEEYFKSLVLYIHLNPEKHGIFSNFSNYKYSSYKTYLSNKPTLISKELIIDYFDNVANFSYCHQQRSADMALLKNIEEIDY